MRFAADDVLQCSPFTHKGTVMSTTMLSSSIAALTSCLQSPTAKVLRAFMEEAGIFHKFDCAWPGIVEQLLCPRQRGRTRGGHSLSLCSAD